MVNLKMPSDKDTVKYFWSTLSSLWKCI